MKKYCFDVFFSQTYFEKQLLPPFQTPLKLQFICNLHQFSLEFQTIWLQIILKKNKRKKINIDYIINYLSTYLYGEQNK
jgi:hypothetical protein